ncbi:MAG: Rax2 family protein [Tsuneonella suprasediminis]|nr:Rax2 family protein [Tsuneonella suprasediminis]
MTPEEEEIFKRRRKGRNLALALGLTFFVVLFYFITIAKMG